MIKFYFLAILGSAFNLKKISLKIKVVNKYLQGYEKLLGNIGKSLIISCEKYLIDDSVTENTLIKSILR